MRELRIFVLTLIFALVLYAFYEQRLAPRPVYGWRPVPEASFTLDGYTFGAQEWVCIAHCEQAERGYGNPPPLSETAEH